MKLYRSASVIALLLSGIASTAHAVTVLPGNPTWGNPLGENSTGGSSAITGTAPRSGNGSIELFGDRTRFVGLGNPYSNLSNIGLLSDLTSFTFDWSVAVGSTNPYHQDYTPALRLHLYNAAGTQRSELIWEGAYNGVYGNMTKGTWYTSGAGDNFWQFVTGVGATEIYNRDLGDWKSIYGAGTYIAAVSVGVGSGASANYHAFADNITLQFGSSAPVTYNFEVTQAPVPDSGATFGLVGFVLAGLFALRRRFSR